MRASVTTCAPSFSRIAHLSVPNHAAHLSVSNYAVHLSPADFIGGASEDTVAQTIATACGPSGHNDEYLFRICEWLRAHGEDDAHAFALERAVRNIQRK